jgi:hypothetical protein
VVAGPPAGADPVAVGEALAGWLEGRFGGAVAVAEPPSTAAGGLDRSREPGRSTPANRRCADGATTPQHRQNP